MRAKASVVEGVVGYVRVSTEEQAQSGLGLESQRKALRAECRRRGTPLLAVYEDAGRSGKSLARPELAAALAAVEGGHGTILMVTKLDRLTRSVHDATGLMLRADKAGWGLVALDVAVDTTTPQGAAMAQVLAVFAELERRLIGQRTKDALAIKKAQGVRLGRAPSLDPKVRRRIVDEHLAGVSWAEIARQLNAQGIPTAQGTPTWHPASVRYIALRALEPR